MPDSTPRTQVERWIADVLNDRRWSVRQWAARAGVPPQAIYRFRSGTHKTISPKNMEKLHAAVNRPT